MWTIIIETDLFLQKNLIVPENGTFCEPFPYTENKQT